MAFAKSPQMSAKIRKSQATTNLGTSVQIYNLKVRAPVLYIVALSELKLNENSEHDEVVISCHVPKYAACLNPFSFQVVSGNILYAFVTDFLRKIPWEIKRNTFSFTL